MNWPNPSMCSWMCEDHVAALKEEEFHAFQDSWCSSPLSPWRPRSVAPHTPPVTPSAADLAPPQAQYNLHCPKCSLYCSLHITQPWHWGEQRPGNNSYLVSTQENTRRSIFLIGNIFSSAYCISWSTSEAQGRVGLFKTLRGRGHAPMSQSHLVEFEGPADSKHVK